MVEHETSRNHSPKRSRLTVKKRIHVNQHRIKSNGKTGAREPVLTIKTYKSNTYAHEVEITGPCRVVYRPDKPLPCGAKVWIETDSEVIPFVMDPEALDTHLELVGDPDDVVEVAVPLMVALTKI